MQILAALIMLALCGQTAHAGTITANLDCVVLGSDSVSCDPLNQSWGTVTLNDSAATGILVTVDLLGTGMKFRDLMLNFNPGTSGITSFSSSDGQAVSLAYNSFSTTPYAIGLFDVGVTGGLGWNGDDPYSTTLTGVGGTLTLAMFEVLDATNALNVSLHLQNMPPNGGSLKVGGLWGEDGAGGTGEPIPEPASAALLGSGMIALVWALRRRKAS